MIKNVFITAACIILGVWISIAIYHGFIDTWPDMSLFKLKTPGTTNSIGEVFWFGTDANGKDIYLSSIVTLWTMLQHVFLSLLAVYTIAYGIVLLRNNLMVSINLSIDFVFSVFSSVPAIIVYLVLAISLYNTSGIVISLSLALMPGVLYDFIEYFKRRITPNIEAGYARLVIGRILVRTAFCFYFLLTVDFLGIYYLPGWAESVNFSKMLFLNYPHAVMYPIISASVFLLLLNGIAYLLAAKYAFENTIVPPSNWNMSNNSNMS